MKRFFVFFSVSVCIFFSILGESKAALPKYNDGVYIVYMGAAASSNSGTIREDQALLMNSLIKRDALVHSYTKGFSGFAARLTEEEARSIAQHPGVVSVFPDPILQLHTTRSWDFLKLLSNSRIRASKKSSYAQPSASSGGSDTIIGILDTGIWPESVSFDDDGMGPIPTRWKGKCEEGKDFKSTNCNRKIIGARYYSKGGSPRDKIGHGTHVASTAAGSVVDGASFYGVANGTARGGSPSSRIAMYQVCSENGGCVGSHILKGYDDAIGDGVDVLSLSLGTYGGYKPDFTIDVIAIGAFHAVENGIAVVCAAGNSGPRRSYVTNDAPWIFTVAASNIDREFVSEVVLGGNKFIKGIGIHLGKLKKSPAYPLATGASVQSKNSNESNARDCLPDSLDPAKAKGNIILCESQTGSFYSFEDKADEVKRARGVGAICIATTEEDVAITSDFGTFPASVVLQEDSNQIFTYISSTKKPVATILKTETIIGQKTAPSVIYFSSRGPSLATSNILKPDITAPGVDILAAWPDDQLKPKVSPGWGYYIISGTSMACPHVSGIVGAVMAKNPTFSPSALRSAIMTTTVQTNNKNAPMTNSNGTTATPYDCGAGEASLRKALEPGLVYETEIEEYVVYLCANGYNTSQIRLISSKIPKSFKCPDGLTEDTISTINYPSIAVSKLKDGESKTITRTATNVGDEESVYTATIEAMTGVEVTVTPNELKFTKKKKMLTYEVTFTTTLPSPEKKDIFGSITWTSGKYKVRSPIVVTTE